MSKRKTHLLTLLIVLLIGGCSTTRYQATFFESPPEIDTKTNPIEIQEKKSYDFNDGEISFDNLFDAARMNLVKQDNDSTFTVHITPENSPINPSPWYAFRIITKDHQNLSINIDYDSVKHRYQPKWSMDAKSWKEIPLDKITLSQDSSSASFMVPLRSDTTWVAGQEIENSKKVIEWCKSIEEKGLLHLSQIGKSKLDRPLYMLDSDPDYEDNKPIVVILSRQHPPEVTGYYAMKAFIETVATPASLSIDFLNNYRVLVFPLMNPDGVDLGHWRHNAGGIDLNRDWGTYHQPETRQVADKIVKLSKQNKSTVLLGIDFHSTYYDVYYTKDVDKSTLVLPEFKDEWLEAIDNDIEDYTVNEQSSRVDRAVFTNNWFYKQFNAIGITYEIGDTTPRDFIHTKGSVSATAMMELLLKYKREGL